IQINTDIFLLSIPEAKKQKITYQIAEQKIVLQKEDTINSRPINAVVPSDSIVQTICQYFIRKLEGSYNSKFNMNIS
ncbi:28713_t:CDS:1, partial [Gigaspora margarita]